MNDLDEVLDAIDSDFVEEEEHVSRLDLLTRYMLGLGFSRKGDAIDKNTIEFAKIYSDPNGRTSRVVAVVRLDEVGLDPKCAEYFTVTIQIHVAGTDLAVQTEAPTFCRSDLQKILAHFEPVEDPGPTEICSRCGTACADFLNMEGDIICFVCSNRGS